MLPIKFMYYACVVGAVFGALGLVSSMLTHQVFWIVLNLVCGIWNTVNAVRYKALLNASKNPPE